MLNIETTSAKMVMRMAGIAGIGVGLFILPFAFIDISISTDISTGGIFTKEVLEGKDIGAWLDRVHNNADLVKFALVLPAIGFTLMALAGLGLFALMKTSPWQKYAALAGYIAGVPLAVYTFVSTHSLVSSLLKITDGLYDAGSIKSIAAIRMHEFMMVNYCFGPLFIIVIGNSFTAYACLKEKILPKWLAIWGMINGILMIAGIMSVKYPALAFGEAGGPLTMLWFLILGITLLRKSTRVT